MKRLLKDDCSVNLARCPIGLFETLDGVLCMKTESGLNAYIVSSGEKFWGSAKNQEELAAERVIPCKVVDPEVYQGEAYL